MNWRDAFIAQARSDHAIFERLNTPGVEHCHRLHYLQMVSEKLAKGILTRPTQFDPPEPTHAVFVRLLRVLKTSIDAETVNPPATPLCSAHHHYADHA